MKPTIPRFRNRGRPWCIKEPLRKVRHTAGRSDDESSHADHDAYRADPADPAELVELVEPAEALDRVPQDARNPAPRHSGALPGERVVGSRRAREAGDRLP